MKIFKYLFEAILIYTFFLLGRLIGLTLSRKFFSFIFKIIGPLIKSKTIMHKNLKIFDKNISNENTNKILSSMWSNYGMTFIEYIYLKRFRKNNSHVNILGEDVLKNIIENKKPVIFISGHFANFELMSMEITKKKINLATIYRPLNNFFLNPFMEYLRKKYVCKNQIKKGLSGVKKIINYINHNISIALMIDQRVSEGDKIDFFGHECSTTTLPAQLALKYNLKIVPVFIKRRKDNFFEIEFYNPIEITKFSNKKEISKKLNQIIEKMVIKNPSQWIWTHNRWK